MSSTRILIFCFSFIAILGSVGNNGVNGHALDGIHNMFSAAAGGIHGALDQAKKGVQNGDLGYRAGRFFNELGKGAVNVAKAGVNTATNVFTGDGKDGEGAVNKVNGALKQVRNVGGDVGYKAGHLVNEIGTGAVNNVRAGVGNAKNIVTGVNQGLAQGVNNVNGALNQVGTKAVNAVQNVRAVGGDVGYKAGHLVNQIGTGAVDKVRAGVDNTRNIVTGVNNGVAQGLNVVKDDLEQVRRKGGDIGYKAGHLVNEVGTGAVNNVKAGLGNVKNYVSGVHNNAKEGIHNVVSNARGGVNGALEQAKKGVQHGDIGYRAGRFFNELGKGAVNTAKAGFDTFANILTG